MRHFIFKKRYKTYKRLLSLRDRYVIPFSVMTYRKTRYLVTASELGIKIKFLNLLVVAKYSREKRA